MLDNQKARTEEYQVDGMSVFEKSLELYKEGNVRRLIIKNINGRTVLKIPLFTGLVGTVLRPLLWPLGMGALIVASLMLTKSTIVVERESE